GIPVLRFGLHVDLPGAAEAVEEIDVDATKVGLQRLVHVLEHHALCAHLVAVHVGVDLRHGRLERGERPLCLRSLGHYRLALPRILGEVGGPAAAAILEHERHAAGGANARDRRWRERIPQAFAHLRQPLAHVAQQAEVLGFRRLPLIPRLQRNEEESVVGSADLREQAVARYARHVFDPGRLHQYLLDLSADFGGALERRAGGQLYPCVDESVVLRRNETALKLAAQPSGADGDDEQQRERDYELANQQPGDAHVTVRKAIEAHVEAPEEPAERPFGLGPLTQQQRGERGRERQGIEG